MEMGSRLGQGQTAEVFEWGPDTVLKLHYDWVPSEWIQRQLAMDRLVEQLGAPCPKVFECLEINGRIGITYERVRGNSMLCMMESSPHTVLHYSRTMARLHQRLHHIVTSYSPSQKGKLRDAILQSKSLLDPTTLTKVLSRLDTLPDGQVLCHGDFHPDNILVTEAGDSVIVDWANASIGHSIADVARTFLILSSPFIPPNIGALMAVAFKTIRPLVRYEYIREYRRLSGTSISEIMTWLPPVAAARLREDIPGEREWLMELIYKRINGA